MPFNKYNSKKDSAGKPMSEEQALARLTALCASAEHCTGEMIPPFVLVLSIAQAR